MRAYLSIIRMRFNLLLQYRVAALAGIATQLLFGFVRVMVFYALYQYSTGTQPMTYGQTITYIWIGQATLGILPWGGDLEIQAMIRSGNVAYELCRPINLYNQWLARAIAFRTAPMLLRAIPIFVIALFFLPKAYAMDGPTSVSAFGAWLIAIIGAIILSSAITNLANIITLWTISGEGIVRLIPAVVNMFSGMIVPLPFFPEWIQGTIGFLPFRGLVDTPIRFYMGHIPPSQLFPHLMHQLLWAIGLIAFGQWLLYKKMKEITIQGG